MGQLLLYVAAALVIAAIVFGVTVMLGGGDPGLAPTEPDGQAVPLPGDRPLGEEDLVRTKFDTAFRGYRMSQVDQALQRAAYDIGYKGELIGVLEAEVLALREGRIGDADLLRRAREAALAPPVVADDVAAITEGPATGLRETADEPDDAATGPKPAGEATAGRTPAADVGTEQNPAPEAGDENGDRNGEPAERR
ncbi:MAG TPA: DivIVA domain-containing protein [Actinoplanes sp.]|jgi:DivIVA domain-containing protein